MSEFNKLLEFAVKDNNFMKSPLVLQNFTVARKVGTFFSILKKDLSMLKECSHFSVL